MKKSLTILLLAAFPMLALAAGEHAGGGGHNMADMQKDMAGMHKEMGEKHHDEASAAGQAGDPAKVSRTIAVEMNDTMRFTPGQISVKAGETIRFFIKNSGKIPHEMVIGTMGELKEHAEMMRKMPGMMHAEKNQITLNAGQRGAIVWKFDKAGEVDFACLVPGHMEAGMVGKVRVE
ncbi:MAG: cupredoxin family protein [Gammaproteobacteria bacterium]|nr:cupredoxin family protein [Gammaproteobacteria bacterium]MBU0786577.1 cupredoxin family protein [Gammaproteobacteria bacterium]MBU0814352.1 cupredoxin family protein [Gammaproteobacteria bacterium]MBU1787695.1 cupredoxin family protein [Gammaproteobacteria bacterium]